MTPLNELRLQLSRGGRRYCRHLTRFSTRERVHTSFCAVWDDLERRLRARPFLPTPGAVITNALFELLELTSREVSPTSTV